MKRYTMVGSLLIIFLCLPANAKELQLSFDEGNPSITFCSPETIECIFTTSVTASSYLKAGKYDYLPKFAADREDKTAWCEGKDGPGIGEWIQYNFKKKVTIAGIRFVPKYAKSKATLFNNNRVKKMEMETDGGQKWEIGFSPDDSREHAFAQGAQIDYLLPYVDFTNKKNGGRKISASWIKFTIKDVYPGDKASDTCISGIDLVTSSERER